MIARLTILMLALAVETRGDGMEAQEQLEAAKKEQIYKEWMQKLREGSLQFGFTNFADSPFGEKMVLGIFEDSWIHSSFGLYWDEIPPPTIQGSNGMAGVEAFITENGWQMLTNEWMFLTTLDRHGKSIHSLPWEAIKARTFQAATHDGILYILLRSYVVLGSSGLAYNPHTNRFHFVTGFRPIGDHWYAWEQTDTPGNERSWYEGEKPGSANKKRNVDNLERSGGLSAFPG